MEQCAQLMEEALRLLDGFVECPTCNGEQGSFAKGKHWELNWDDCHVCQGHGMLPIGESKWQDEGRTYTPAERQLDTRIDGIAVRREAA